MERDACASSEQRTSQVGKLVQKKCHSNAIISKIDLLSYIALHNGADIIQYILVQWLAQRSQASSSCNDHANDNRISEIRILTAVFLHGTYSKQCLKKWCHYLSPDDSLEVVPKVINVYFFSAQFNPILPNRTQTPWADSACIHPSVPKLREERRKVGRRILPLCVLPGSRIGLYSYVVSLKVWKYVHVIKHAMYIKQNFKKAKPKTKPAPTNQTKNSHSCFSEDFCTTAQKTRFIPWKMLEADYFFCP